MAPLWALTAVLGAFCAVLGCNPRGEAPAGKTLCERFCSRYLGCYRPGLKPVIDSQIDSVPCTKDCTRDLETGTERERAILKHTESCLPLKSCADFLRCVQYEPPSTP
jgi:hypothetical protein